MNETYDLRAGESHIEVHKFHGGTILLSLLIAVVLQSFLPVYIARAGMLDLPLLITIYFGLSRRNPSTGLLLAPSSACCRTASARRLSDFSGSPRPSSATWRHRLARASIPNTRRRVSPSRAVSSSFIKAS